MKKRIIALGLALLMVCCWAAALANDMQTGSMYVNTANGRALRFRNSKSTKGTDNILCEIPYGAKVYVVNWDGTWARVKYNNAVGYVVQKHLSIARPKDYETVVAEREAAKEAEKAAKEAAKKAAEDAKAAKEAAKAAEAKAKAEAKAAEAEAKAAAKAAEEEAKAAAKEAAELEAARIAELKKADAALDQSKITTQEIYDVTVRIGVVDMTVPMFKSPSLLAATVAEYPDGARLSVCGRNNDWAWVYDGAADVYGYMLLEDLENDIM